MLPSRITDIWRCLSLPHNVLVDQLIDAMRTARDPAATLLDCPWNYADTAYGRACRVAWRVAFRITREHGAVPLITIREAA
jgi:hypothetical protein